MANKVRSYPTDVSDEEWAFCAPYLTLMDDERAPQRRHSLREVFNALRWRARAGCSWRGMPHEFASWPVVQQQTPRWIRAGSFEAMAHDLRVLLRPAAQRATHPARPFSTAARSSLRPRAAHARASTTQKTQSSKVHAAVDTLGQLLALKVMPANEQDRAQVAELTRALPEVRGEQVEVAFVDQGYTGEQPAADAAQAGVRLEVVEHEAKRGFVLLSRRWLVEHSFAWAALPAPGP